MSDAEIEICYLHDCEIEQIIYKPSLKLQYSNIHACNVNIFLLHVYGALLGRVF